VKPSPRKKCQRIFEQALRRTICESAVSILAEKGFEGMTMSAVAARADLATGTLYNYFNYIFENSLEKARGKSGLKSILLLIAREGGATVSELAFLISKKSGETRTLLKRLIETDLIVQEGHYYSFRDSLLSQWLRMFYLGLEMDEKTKSKQIEEVLSQLEEKYVRTATELGRAKEYELKSKLEKQFKTKLSRYEKKGIEFDLVGEKEGTVLIFEIKWRNKLVGYKDIKQFIRKVGKSEFSKEKKELLFISKSGFTDNAQKLASKHGIELRD